MVKTLDFGGTLAHVLDTVRDDPIDVRMRKSMNQSLIIVLLNGLDGPLLLFVAGP